jgi:hypothetical protein
MSHIGLWDLPVELTTDLCSNWLTIVDVAFLDSAICNHAMRAHFVAVAFSSSCSLRYPIEEEHDDTEYEDGINIWIVKRRARVSGLYITKHMYSASVSDYFKSHGKFLQFIRFQESKFGEYTTSRKNAKSTDKTLVSNIAAHCPNLRKLETNSGLTDRGFAQIVRSCAQLEDVCNLGSETAECVITALNNSPCLRKLNIGLGGRSKSRVTCPTLESVEIHHSGELGDAFCTTLARSCPRLQALEIDVCEITDATLDALAAHCRDFLTLGAISPTITWACLERFTAACNLREVHIYCYDMPATSVYSIAQNCPLLRHLHVHSPGTLSEEWLLAVAAHCPDLRELDLDGLWLKEAASGLLAVAEHCHELRSLLITFLRGDTGPFLFTAISHCARLERFVLNDAASDALLYALSRCPHLRDVQLTHEFSFTARHSVTAEGIIALAKGCPALVVLRLPDHAVVDMEVVRVLSRCCPDLRVLQCTFPVELNGHRMEIAGLLPNCNVSKHSQLRFR